MSFYRTGTLAFINGSTAVVGSGTDFINGAATGECIQAPDSKLYEILSIQSATALTLGQAYLGATASGQTYSIVPTQSYIRDLASQAATLVNSYSATQANALRADAADKASIVDADKLGGRDSVTGLARMFPWSGIKTAISTWLETLSATWANKTLTSPDINGGTIDGAVIGGVVPAAGSFTALSASPTLGNTALTLTGSPGYAATLLTQGGTGAGGLNNAITNTGGSLIYGVSRNDGLAPFANGTAYSGYIGTTNATPLQLASNNSVVATVSSTGISVTGGISASGVCQASDLTFNSQAGTLGYQSTNGPGIEAYSTTHTNPNVLAFRTSNLERMRLDASGNLGLGVVPSGWLATGNSAIELKGEGSLFGGTSYDTSGVFLGANLYYNGIGGYSHKYKVSSEAATYYGQRNGEHSWFTAPSGTAGAPISFTQAMTLDSSGNLLVGQTAVRTQNSRSLDLDRVDGCAYINHLTGDASGNLYAAFGLGGVSIGSITQSGTTGVLYNTTSDARLKTNVIAAPDAASLIDAIQVRSFDWLSDNSHQRYGFVAQELYEVAPEAVSKPANPDEMMSLDYSKLVPMLVKEVQSLRARVAQLEGI